MTASPSNRRTFGKRREPHRIIIARGQDVQSYTINPWLALSVGVVGLLMTFAYFGATAYLIYRDDIIGGALARQARLQHAYEDRIAALRTQIDRINARQLIDQDAFEAKIAELMKRQEQLVATGGAVGDLMMRAQDAGLDLTPTTTGAFGKTPTPKPEVKPAGAFRSSAAPARGNDKRPGARIAAVADEIDAVTKTQVSALEALARDANDRAAGIRRVANKLGLPIDAAIEATPRPKAGKDAVGGPFEALPPGPFRDRLVSADMALAQFLRVRAGVERLPIRRPTGTENAITSEFGPRRDPFLGVMAMHTGIDFRGASGDPIRATAAGTVTKAGREGGYGLMVEIDHGGGLTTRFAHMSRIRVDVGDSVKVGDVVGLVGSTGRSTGPHLHYETRVNGDAVNPMTYLSAGRQLKAYME